MHQLRSLSACLFLLLPLTAWTGEFQTGLSFVPLLMSTPAWHVNYRPSQSHFQVGYKYEQWTLNLSLLADWGVASSLFEAMWTAADTAPNTTLAISFTAITGAVFACNVFPVFPSVGATAPDAQTDTWTMLVDGTPADTFS